MPQQRLAHSRASTGRTSSPAAPGFPSPLPKQKNDPRNTRQSININQLKHDAVSTRYQLRAVLPFTAETPDKTPAKTRCQNMHDEAAQPRARWRENTRRYFHAKTLQNRYSSSGPSIVPVEHWRLPAIGPVESLGADQNNQ